MFVYLLGRQLMPLPASLSIKSGMHIVVAWCGNIVKMLESISISFLTNEVAYPIAGTWINRQNKQSLRLKRGMEYRETISNLLTLRVYCCVVVWIKSDY